MRTFLLIFAAAGVVALSGCGPVSNASTCGPATCAGCCDATGVCRSGGDSQFCGTGGFTCNTCFAGQVCQLGGCTQQQVCRPKTCADAQKNCGEIDDGCGGTVQCGTCGQGQSCGAGGVANVCGAGTCTPKTCAGLQAECGKVSDGCSAQLSCGQCSGGALCGGGGANKCGACNPKSCTELGKNCGQVDDGCRTLLDCGASCPSGQSCGGGGVSNVCGAGACTPKSCAALSKNCGLVNDGCGNMVNCGATCPGTQTCGGGGVSNVCGASCAVSCPNGFSCNAMGACAGGNLNGGLVLNEVGHVVSGRITVNGATPSRNATYCANYPNNEIAEVTFYEKTKGYSATVSIFCNVTDFSFNTLLPPGTWEMRVSRGGYATNAGVNLLPVSYLAQPALQVSGPVTGLLLNEVGHAVSGRITVNGATPSRSATYCANYPGNEIAEVNFYEKAKGYSASVSILCNVTDFSFNTLLPPGTWEVRVDRGGYATNAGVNLLPVSYLAQAALQVSAPLSGLLLDEVGHAVSGRVTVNGAVPSRSATYCANYPGNEIAEVNFYEKTKGYQASVSILCNVTDFSFNTLLPPGTWEVRVSRGGYATNAGVNLLPVSYLAQAALQVSAPVAGLLLNEVGHAVSGRVTVNGATPSRSATYCANYPGNEIAEVNFYEKTKGYQASVSILCNVTDFSFNTLLPPGTWEVRIDRGGYATNAGVNLLPVSYLAQTALQVSGPSTGLLFNEVGHPVSGRITVNGATPSRSASYCANYPGNEIAEVNFYEETAGYKASVSILCNVTDFSFNTLLPPGTWEVRVDRGGYATNAGVNLLPVSYLARTALVVNGPVSNLLLDELAHTVAGRITVNGATPSRSSTYCANYPNNEIAEVNFYEKTAGYSASVSIFCNVTDFSFSTLLPAGNWEVRVDRGGYSTNAGVNLLPVSYLAVERLAVP